LGGGTQSSIKRDALRNPTVILNSIQDPGLGMTGQMPDMLVALSRGFRVQHGMTGCGMGMILPSKKKQGL
jgi:hypothetical protein